ncbi:hypothetical protein GGD38_005935 [Chitinophagaceae bacterium OAS944]|nr:hypothetical protein [Chitinophagaceae bacterium OAS944]
MPSLRQLHLLVILYLKEKLKQRFNKTYMQLKANVLMCKYANVLIFEQ